MADSLRPIVGSYSPAAYEWLRKHPAAQATTPKKKGDGWLVLYRDPVTGQEYEVNTSDIGNPKRGNP